MARRAWERHLRQAGELVGGLRELLEDEAARTAFYLGSMFPDWGYLGLAPDAAEHTHWRAFQDGYADRLARELGPVGWNADERIRVAFFLGVVSHGVTDIPWHFGRRSFLAEARAADADLSHSAAEIGGDLLLFADRDRPIDLDRRLMKWPLDDVEAVLADQGVAVTRRQLEAGCLRMESTWRAGALGGALGAAAVRRRHPWLVEHLADHPYGGVDHGAAATAVWVLHYYGRLRGRTVLQNTPAYARAGGEHCHAYDGCRSDGSRISFRLPDGRRPAAATLWLFLEAAPGPGRREVAVRGADGALLDTVAIEPGDRGWIGWAVGPAAGGPLTLTGHEGLSFVGPDAFAGDDGPRFAWRPVLVLE